MQGYNAQAVVSEEQIIVAVGVTQETNDVQQLLVFEGELHILLAHVEGPDALPRWRMGAARKVRTGLTAIGGRNSGRPSALMWLWKSRSLSGSVILLRCSKNIIPSAGP